jgi:hypothetical protein
MGKVCRSRYSRTSQWTSCYLIRLSLANGENLVILGVRAENLVVELGIVVFACNPTYSECRGRRIMTSRSAWVT